MDRQELISSVTDQEQRSFIKICLILDKSATFIHNQLKSGLGSRAYALRTVEHWLTEFRRGRKSTETAPIPGRLSSSRTDEQLERLKELLCELKSWSVRELAFKLELSKTTVHRMLRENLGLVKKLGKWVPHLLTEEQMEHRCLVANINLKLINRHNYLLKSIVAIDESWVSLYTPPQRNQRQFWLPRGAAAPEIPNVEIHERKRLLILAMDFDGVAFYELLNENETLNSNRYLSFIEEYIPQWCQQKRCRRPLILHDNARPHKARIIRDLIKERG